MFTPKDNLSNLEVAVYHDPNLKYPINAPFSPSKRYPEYFLKDINVKEENKVYDALRQTLFLLGLDKENFGRKNWNPFKDLIKPGETVVIKPNFILSKHYEGGDLFSIITHPSIIRAVVDYVYIALTGKGRIIIADAPQMNCNWQELLEKTQLLSIRELYQKEHGFNLEIYDLRNFWLEIKTQNRYKLPGDPMGSVLVNLGRDSLFYGVKNYQRFYGADYNRDETIKHHCQERQEYLISKTIFSADVVISIPKLKVHKKVGVTLNIKGLVGTVTNKNYLVHYTLGLPSEGGDQFPDKVLTKKEKMMIKLQRWAFDKFLAPKNKIGQIIYQGLIKFYQFFLKPFGFKVGKDKIILDAGNWYGNDSAWRMAVDLYKIFLYADKNGQLHSSPQRRMFSIIDGIMGGENNGPLTPDAKHCGLIAAGYNFGAVDLVCTRLMGFDYKKIKMLYYIVEHSEIFKVQPQAIKIFSHQNFDRLFDPINKDKYFNFIPHPGWIGHIEI